MSNGLRVAAYGFFLAAAVTSLALLPMTGASAASPDKADAGVQPLRPVDSDVDANLPTLYPRANYQWPYAAGPILGDVDAGSLHAEGVLNTVAGAFDTSRGLNLPAELRAANKLGKQQAQYFLLQVDTESIIDGSFAGMKSSVEAAGGALVQNLGPGAFIVRLTANAHAALVGQGAVRYLEPYHPAFKLDPAIGRTPLPDPVKALSSVYSLEIRLFPGEDASQVAVAIRTLGGTVTSVVADAVSADVDRSKLADVASLDAVYAVYEEGYYVPLDEKATTTVQTGKWNQGAVPYHDVGVDGSGNGIGVAQVLSIMDTGISLDAGDLSHTKTSAGTPGATHRKVVDYRSTIGWGTGNGDTLSCDAPATGGFTHGHIVASLALGNASATPVSYGGSWYAIDPKTHRPWKVDGVAPGARLAAFDCQVSPTLTACVGPTSTTLKPGTAYVLGSSCVAGQLPPPTGTDTGTLCFDYGNFGAKVFNWSWGTITPLSTYGTYATQADNFLYQYPDAMLFVAIGNLGLDSNKDFFPDPLRSADPATCKNCVVVGSHNTANDSAGPDYTTTRYSTSGTGPATSASQRITPLVMAPGSDIGALGVRSSYACRSDDNDQLDPVSCDIPAGQSGTSFASAVASGTGLLIRDYFAQGFYPDGTSANTGNAADLVPNISGALLKDILMLSGEFMDGNALFTLPTVPTGYRFNVEQGYGRIKLNNVLPLATYPSPPSMIIADGGIAGGKNDTTLTGVASAAQGTETYSFTVADSTHELRVGLAWTEPSGDLLANDLDLELVSPSGKTYYGNYFTDDDNKNRTLNTGEDCAVAPWEIAGLIDQSRWSLPACGNSDRDSKNPTEGIFLSPDPMGNGLAAYNQVEYGTWTLRVIPRTVATTQRYAVVIVGPVSRGSWVGLDVHRMLAGTDTVVKDAASCIDRVGVVVDEFADASDPVGALTGDEIASRTTLEVYNLGADLKPGTADDGPAVDTESGSILTFTQDPGTNVWRSGLVSLNGGTTPDPGNGVLDVGDGQYIKVTYDDETGGVPDPAKRRTGIVRVVCRVSFEVGTAKFALFGIDAPVAVNGGCERDARGYFTFGYPDQYMDHGERLDIQLMVRQNDTVDLEGAVATLRAVYHDLDSPEGCRPSTTDCADPNRTNNAPVDPSIMNVVDSPKVLGFVPSLFETQPDRYTAPVFAISFTVQMGPVIDGLLDVDLLLGISAEQSGRATEGLVVYRTSLNANETALYYSTDFPTGGTEEYDWNNNETLENPATYLGDLNYRYDYRFETITWSDLTAGGTRNLSLQAPWNFDTNNGGFTSGIVVGSTTTLAPVPSNWGEDMNYNNVLDPGEDRDPSNGILDQNWGTQGGCGWVTKAPGQPTGGVWHTGTIHGTSELTCMADGTALAQCQRTEMFPASSGGGRYYWEELRTPIVEKVNQQTLPDGRPVYRTQFTNWAWNLEIDLPDSWTRLSWEFDRNVDSYRPVTLGVPSSRAGQVYGWPSVYGPFGAVSGRGGFLYSSWNNWLDGYPQFTDYGIGGTTSWNGTVGGNREAKNCCYFEQAGDIGRHNPPIFPQPPDDDLRNGWCNNPSDPADKQTSCTVATASTDCISSPAHAYDGTCRFDDSTSTDLFVKKNGPLRNMNQSMWGLYYYTLGDGRFVVMEEDQGEDGVRYQAAIGYVVNEGNPSYPPQVKGYGVAIDDMVMEWKEFRLDEDTTTDCAAGGSCATLDVSATQHYDALGRVVVTVTDSSPGTPPARNNDCDHNGAYTDAGIDSQDCDGDGARDVYVKAWSDAEPTGEWVLLNETAPGSFIFRGNLPVSSAYDSPGTLFVRREGTLQPVVTLQYMDPDDGAGHPCQRGTTWGLDPALWGQVQATVTLNVSTGRVVVKGSRITNDAGKGDGDPFADTNETVNMYVTVSNKTGKNLTNLVARLASNSPYVDCIIQPQIVLPSLPIGAIAEIPSPFVWKVTSTANRSNPFDDLSAKFTVTLSADQFDAAESPQEIAQDLDLDVTGGGALTTLTEGFESAGFGIFTSMSLDSMYGGTPSTTPPESTVLADGTRCQYNDPDYINSNSYGETYCYPGFSYGVVAPYRWHIHGTSSPDGGRAYLGNQSLHWGVHLSATDANRDTSQLSALQAIRMTDPVNLAYAATPELSFKHQISLADYRLLSDPYLTGVDRGVVGLQIADAAGNPAGVWHKLYPYQSIYDMQPIDHYISCAFDPMDDGNDEDSYFDPTDPERRYGPSSTCWPEFSFGAQGNTDWRNGFVPGLVNRASDDPVGLKGSIDRGNWVETRFNLDRYKGRRVRVRMLVSTIKNGDVSDWVTLGYGLNRTTEDGWWIDDFQITNLLTSPATVAADTADNSALPGCPGNCTVIAPSLVASAGTLAGPSLPVTLDASGAVADACLGGVLQFRFLADGVVAQDWSDMGVFTDSPTADTAYRVSIRCSSAPGCVGTSGDVLVHVSCPASGSLVWTGPLTVFKKNGTGGAEPDQDTAVGWGADSWTDVLRGDLVALRASKTFSGSVVVCTANNTFGAQHDDGSVVLPGQVQYFLARGATCNVNPYSYLVTPADAKEVKFCSNNTAQPCGPAYLPACSGGGTCTVTKDTTIRADSRACE